MGQKEEIEALSIAISTQTPVLLWGPPGTGKTATVQSIARAMGCRFETVIASLREPSDFAGLPVVGNDGKVTFAPPKWATNLIDGGNGILFLDELSTAPPSVQKALLRVVHERMVGDLRLPDKTAIIAAANPPEQGADAWDLAPPLANRFIHMNYSGLDAREWADCFITDEWPSATPYQLPEDWTKNTKVRALLAAFLRSRPALLHQMPENESDRGRAWPSRRTWDMAGKLLTAARSVRASQDVESTLLTGAVGDGAGIEFLTYLRKTDLPDPEKLLEDPDSYKHPERGDIAYAVLFSVAEAACQNVTKKRVMSAWKIFSISAEAGGSDVSAVVVKKVAQVTQPMIPKLNTQEKDSLKKCVEKFGPILKAGGYMEGM